MKNHLKIFIFIIATLFLTFSFGINDAFAASITFNGVGEFVPLAEEVEEINITGSVDNDIVPILNALKVNPGYNYALYGSNAVINITTTDELSSELITAMAGFAPSGATAIISSSNINFTYVSLPYTLPTGFSVDFTDKTLHLPGGTNVADAVNLFNSVVVAKYVAVGHSYNISAEGSNKITTVHLNQGQNLEDIFDLISAQSLDRIIVAVPDYHVNLLGTTPVIWLEGDLTEKQVLDLVKDLNVNAIIRLLNSSAFTVTLEIGKDPVVTRAINILEDLNTGLTVISNPIKSGGREYYLHELDLNVNKKELTANEKEKYTNTNALDKFNKKYTHAKFIGIDILNALEIELFASGDKLTEFEEGLTLRVPYDVGKYGKENLCVMYVGVSGEIEIIPAKVVEDGLIEFTIYHLSEYALAQGVAGHSENVPSTNDINLIVILVTTVIALAGISFVVIRLRRNKRKTHK